ncbi:MAG: orotidine 5'-phosphate decarboxylase [Parcubacteria group bacterium]|nr:orotidine 5'-phosphate decarboxylase [Parcubacteria group bacterium]
MSTQLFVALDGIKEKTRQTLEEVELFMAVDGDFGFKINLDYVLAVGCEAAVLAVGQFGRPIFVDLKMWNGGRTMASVVAGLAQLGVAYTNGYALADKELAHAVRAAEGTNTEVLGLTVLTHYDDAYCRRHFLRSLLDTVGHLAKVALDAGCRGVILPGTTLGAVADIAIDPWVPGVRPPWYSDDRHSEEITPRAAKEAGVKAVVCGSPIMKSDDKVGALRAVLTDLAA